MLRTRRGAYSQEVLMDGAHEGDAHAEVEREEDTL